MKMLLIIMVCIIQLIHSAAHEFDGAWGFSQEYSVANYNGYEQPSQLIELTEQMVMNPFWLEIKDSCCQDKKILTLIQVLHELPKDDYAARRYNVAAAVYAGINVPRLQSMKKLCRYLLLSDTVEHRDYPLTELLLKNKANPHEKNADDGKPVIYDAQITRLARLLIDFGALQDSLQTCASLLHRAMWLDYEPALIPLYKEHGIDPLTRNSLGWTPLMELVSLGIDYESDETGNTALIKASLLLQDMPRGKVTALIMAEVENERDTVFDLIEDEKRTYNETKKYTLDALRTYFIDTLNSSDSITNKSKKEKEEDDDNEYNSDSSGSEIEEHLLHNFSNLFDQE